MNSLHVKAIFIMLSTQLFCTGLAAAHDINGALGKTAGATDYYQVDCFDDGNGATAYLIVEIKDLPPVVSPMVSVQVTKGKLARNTTDAVDGNAAFAPIVNLPGGNGSYFLTVDKTAAGIDTYNLQVHCETSAGQHTGTQEPILIQNQ